MVVLIVLFPTHKSIHGYVPIAITAKHYNKEKNTT